MKASMIIDDYDQAAALAALRANRATATGELHRATEGLARHLAETLAADLPAIPAEAIGEVLLCAASKMAAMAADRIPLAVAINAAGFAADNLIGTGEST